MTQVALLAVAVRVVEGLDLLDRPHLDFLGDGDDATTMLVGKVHEGFLGRVAVGDATLADDIADDVVQRLMDADMVHDAPADILRGSDGRQATATAGGRAIFGGGGFGGRLHVGCVYLVVGGGGKLGLLLLGLLLLRLLALVLDERLDEFDELWLCDGVGELLREVNGGGFLQFVNGNLGGFRERLDLLDLTAEFVDGVVVVLAVADASLVVVERLVDIGPCGAVDGFLHLHGHLGNLDAGLDGGQVLTEDELGEGVLDVSFHGCYLVVVVVVGKRL